MNIDRLLRDVESRLQDRDPETREAFLDVLREAIARERRRLDPSLTVETERERRLRAEEMREVCDAISRPAEMDEGLAEALRQLARVVEVDFAAVAVAEAGGRYRVVAAHGEHAAGLVGLPLSDPRFAELVRSRQPTNVSDADAEDAALPLPFGDAIRSWAALPLLHEGELVGLLFAGRLAASGLSEDDLHRAKQIASTAAAVLNRGRQLAQVRRFAVLLEQVVALDHRVFHDEPLDKLGPSLLDGACRVGSYRGGMLVLQTPRGPTVVAANGELVPALGRPAPADLAATASRRLSAERMLNVAEVLGVPLPAQQTLLVPLATADQYVGCLVLLDPDGETADDRLIDAYASRVAVAWRHAVAHHSRP